MNIGTEYNATYGYDDYGRLNQVNDIAFGRVTNSDLLGTVTRSNNVNTAWSYEATRNLVSEVNNGAAGALSYLNNAIGNRTSMTRGSEVLSYTYDNRSEVTGAASSTDTNYVYGYNYDPIGNRLTANLAGTNYSYTANTLNQYTLVNTVVPTYDVDGNMLTNGNWTYTWNGENRLTTATDGTTTLNFKYDYLGRRVEKAIAGGETKRFVYDGFKMVECLDGSNDNALLQTYHWQVNPLWLDVPLCTRDVPNAANYYYFTDANKNISELLSSGGAIAAHYEYSPFGMQTAASGSYAAANPFRFSAEYSDPETNLVYYNYRYYNPQLGRWLSKDPIEEFGGLNLYGMIGNTTTNRIDYLGLIPIILIPEIAIPKTQEQISAEERYYRMIKEKFDEANCILRGLLKYADQYRAIHIDNAQHIEKINFFESAATYYLLFYSSPDKWDIVPYLPTGHAINLVVNNPILSAEVLDMNAAALLDILLHEPQHDPYQKGLGHGINSDWGNDISNTRINLELIMNKIDDSGCCEKTGATIKNAYDRLVCECAPAPHGVLL